MLHRVLDCADEDFRTADPIYTLSVELFDQLLAFASENYSVVSLADVIAATKGSRGLPDHALLITFDDGWADNLKYAAPVLAERDLPAVIFASTEPITSSDLNWWQEQIFEAARYGQLDDWLSTADVYEALKLRPGKSVRALDVVTAMAESDNVARARLLSSLPQTHRQSRLMLAASDLATLPKFRIDIGLHGHRHLPLTSVPDVAAELLLAQKYLEILSKKMGVCSALSCPHGQYDDRVISAANSVGIELIFTSDPHLNRIKHGLLTSRRTIGRISIVASHVTDAYGNLDRAALARWLWNRELR